MKLEYTGLKQDGETAFIEESGIRWFPGDVHDVPAGIAKKMLGHPSMWKSTDADMVLAASKMPSNETMNPGVPAWALAGIQLSLTDEQLESIAQAGGPATEAGAKLWMELTGAPVPEEVSAPALPPEPKAVMRLPDGTVRILDDLTREQLHDLAKELRVPVHPMTGIHKVTDALLAAYPVKKK